MKILMLTGRSAALLCLLFICLCATVQAQQTPQDTTTLYRVQTLDGNEYVGAILEQNEEFILLRTRNLGEITIARKDIRSITPIRPTQVVSGEIWFENPQSTRYFWSPNGYGLKRGEGYYQNVWILFNQASIGITDNISMGVGTVPLFLFAGTSSPVWITPKVSVPVSGDKVALGAGALLGTVLGEEGTGFGILYGIGTVGSRDKNASVGVGYAFAGGEMANSPVITLSGMLRVGKGGYLLTENYIIPAGEERFALLMLGGRSIIKKIGLDYGLLIPAFSGDQVFFGLPWLGLTVPFGAGPAQPR
ncbi:hypothetical protein [Cesiribacter andamanensis]|uniref:Uncharacterized protein n=1 Tax=Cesiribacter andamanensis AMV16 TaxID=1279009 RepID=M7NRN8_9BACT|nr:hypothetical protein [Cesiribacter andamanensis]EMR01164.1 hypothetical protein ADICEAN_03711 [Cesiribacter andamanensis AMV16]